MGETYSYNKLHLDVTVIVYETKLNVYTIRKDQCDNLRVGILGYGYNVMESVIYLLLDILSYVVDEYHIS